jgi:hypothetical protein
MRPLADAEESVHRPHIVTLANQALHGSVVDVSQRKNGWIPCWTIRLMFSR